MIAIHITKIQHPEIGTIYKWRNDEEYLIVHLMGKEILSTENRIYEKYMAPQEYEEFKNIAYAHNWLILSD